MMANMHHVHHNFGAQLTTLWNTLRGHPEVQDEEEGEEAAGGDQHGLPFFVIPEVRLSITQRMHLTETGFNQGMPFALSADGMSRPEITSVKIRPLVNLCSLHPGTVHLVRVNVHAHLPPHAKTLPKMLRAKLIGARREGQPEYELQFSYSADCDVFLTCFFGAFANKDLSQIKIRVDLPGSKRWEPIRLPRGHNLTFRSSDYGLTLIEQDPVFYRLLRLTTKMGPAKQILEESLRSGIYDAIMTLVPSVEPTALPPTGDSVDPTLAKLGGDVEMQELGSNVGEKEGSESTGIRKQSAQQALLQGKETVHAEYTLCQLLHLPELRVLSAGGGAVLKNDEDDAVALREVERSGDADTDLEGLEERLSEHNKSSLPTSNGGDSGSGEKAALKKVVLDISDPDLDHEEESKSPGKEKLQEAPMQCISQRVQLGKQYFHMHEIYGGDWSWYGDASKTSDAKKQEMDDNEKMCVICLGSLSEVVCIPCRHMCVCWDCANILKEQQTAAIAQHRNNARMQQAEVLKCPMCRARVSVFVHVHKADEE